MTGVGSAKSIGVLAGQQDLAAVLSPVRRQLLENLREPDSATGLARKLGIPRQKINYHLRQLERAGLVELEEERQRRGCLERRVRVTARAFVISPQFLEGLAADPDSIQDRFSSAYLVASAARVVSEVASLRGQIREIRHVESVRYLSKADALAEFKSDYDQEDRQILHGDDTATPPELEGILNRSGIDASTSYSLGGSDPDQALIDSVFSAGTRVREGFLAVDAWLAAAATWETMRLAKDGNRNYLLGPPAEEAPVRLWGIRGVLNENMPAEAAGQTPVLVGAFATGAMFVRRSGIELAITDAVKKIQEAWNRSEWSTVESLCRQLREGAATTATFRQNAAGLDRMERQGVIRGHGPRIDPAALGYTVTAFVTLQLRQSWGQGRSGHDPVGRTDRPTAARRRRRAQPAPSLFAASRKFLTVAVGGLRPSSFSPLRFTQITGTFIFSTGAMSVS